jgi:hypothetical protein
VPAHSWSSARLACGGARRLEALLSATSTAWLDGFIETARPAIAARHRWPWAKAIVGALAGAPESRRFDGRPCDRPVPHRRETKAVVCGGAYRRSLLGVNEKRAGTCEQRDPDDCYVVAP